MENTDQTMATSVQAVAANVMQPSKAGVQLQLRRTTNQQQLRPAQTACSIQPLTSSLHPHFKDLVQRFTDAAKLSAFALATAALLVSSATTEGVPKRLTYDEIQSKMYLEVKGTGTSNQYPTIDGDVDSFSFKLGNYTAKKFCLEPTSFTVKADTVSKNAPQQFQNTKLMNRLTYTLNEMEVPFEVSSDGTVKFEAKDGIDYAAVTVQLPAGERMPFLFTVKQLVASGKPKNFSGEFLVPSYRGSSFLDPKGTSGSTGYDNVVALPAGGRGDEEGLEKENIKNFVSSTRKITLSISQSKPDLVGLFDPAKSCVTSSIIFDPAKSFITSPDDTMGVIPCSMTVPKENKERDHSIYNFLSKGNFLVSALNFRQK